MLAATFPRRVLSCERNAEINQSSLYFNFFPLLISWHTPTDKNDKLGIFRWELPFAIVSLSFSFCPKGMGGSSSWRETLRRRITVTSSVNETATDQLGIWGWGGGSLLRPSHRFPQQASGRYLKTTWMVFSTNSDIRFMEQFLRALQCIKSYICSTFVRGIMYNVHLIYATASNCDFP